MKKEEFKEKLHTVILEGIKAENRIKAFDFKETEDNEDGYIIGTIVYSNGHLAISTSRWDSSTYALDSIDLEIFNLATAWDAAFEFFWDKILRVSGWDGNYEDKLILEKEEYNHGGFFVVKGSKYES
jgi:hypothetical protein